MKNRKKDLDQHLLQKKIKEEQEDTLQKEFEAIEEEKFKTHEIRRKLFRCKETKKLYPPSEFNELIPKFFFFFFAFFVENS